VVGLVLIEEFGSPFPVSGGVREFVRL